MKTHQLKLGQLTIWLVIGRTTNPDMWHHGIGFAWRKRCRHAFFGPHGLTLIGVGSKGFRRVGFWSSV